MKKKLVGVGALTLAITACLGGVASAKAVHATAPFEEGNVSCGLNEPADVVIGTAKFKRSGNKVTLSVTLKKGKATTAYRVDVAGPGCTAPVFFEIIHFTTNAKGKGHGTTTFEVPETATEFFANVYPTGTGEYNESPSVKLP